MLGANETLNLSSIGLYRKQCLGKYLEIPIEELMTLKTIPHDNLHKSISWDSVPIPLLNYFTNHRFFVIKGFACGKQQILYNNPNNMNTNGTLNLYEYIDIQKEMGEFIPNEIAMIINNQSLFDV